HKQFTTTALWRIATPVDAGAIHPIRKAFSQDRATFSRGLAGTFFNSPHPIFRRAKSKGS
ncbi:hypothetical protein, partial [Roseovarius sp. ZX-A-9]|uniref:hypothetical protein n=1 Tax=Roseovarius sp. ZX-A-9 TaxID=3014783 RepID=UPI00232C33BC